MIWLCLCHYMHVRAVYAMTVRQCTRWQMLQKTRVLLSDVLYECDSCSARAQQHAPVAGLRACGQQPAGRTHQLR